MGFQCTHPTLPLPLSELAELQWDFNALIPDGPVHAQGLIVLGCYFMTRELELSCAYIHHMELDVAKSR
eukprot:411514-Amphidinium_carterae.1